MIRPMIRLMIENAEANRSDCKSMYGTLRYSYGSVPRAVASALHTEPRSLPLAVLIQPAFPYTQLQTALRTKNTKVSWFLLFLPFRIPWRSSLRGLSFRCIPASVQSER